MGNLFRIVLSIASVAVSHASWATERRETVYEIWKREAGSRLKQAAEARRVTQKDVADALGLGQARISKVMSAAQSLSVNQGEVAARFLQVSAEWLLAIDVIQDASMARRLRSQGSPQNSNFSEVIQYAKRVDPSGPTVAAENSTNEAMTCEGDLRTYSTEQLVNELRMRGWVVKLER